MTTFDFLSSLFAASLLRVQHVNSLISHLAKNLIIPVTRYLRNAQGEESKLCTREDMFTSFEANAMRRH